MKLAYWLTQQKKERSTNSHEMTRNKEPGFVLFRVGFVDFAFAVLPLTHPLISTEPLRHKTGQTAQDFPIDHPFKTPPYDRRQ